MPKGTGIQTSGASTTQRILQAGPGKQIPQGATIVKLVNAQGQPVGQTAKIVSNVKTIGSNVMTMGKPGGAQVQTVATGPGGKQTIVINKPGGGTLRTAGGQQIIVVTTAGGVRSVQGVTTTQAGVSGTISSNVLGGSNTGGGGVKMIVVSSGQLAATSSKPVMMSMPGQGVKTVALAGKPGINSAGQFLNSSTGQILALPAQGVLPGGTQTMMIGGKPVTVLTGGGGVGGKTVQLVSSGPR